MKVMKGDLLANVSKGLILQQVNCQNVMGSGFAKAVFTQYPIVKTLYHSFCEKHPVAERLGKFQIIQVTEDLAVVNLFGQMFYGTGGKKYTSYDALDAAMIPVVGWMEARCQTSEDVHHPLIGAGLGGGHWPIIREIIQHRIGPETTLWTLD